MSKSSLGTCFVQIVPSADGISGSISKVLGGEAGSAGSSAGSTIAGKIKGALTAAAIGTAIKDSILQGAALEQSLGGVETLFKNHADTVIKNASRAYKTAGISANTYMEQATSFAASLLQSVNGNTAKAAKLTDMALIDMSDNANKMGTSMERITDAYQGFAKQNYTMLDNLKLGYGGTKTEMERLLRDAEKLTGVKYDINNLADVYSAIHAIQGELGITGTTALEAQQTLTGSFNAMKAAAQDFMGNLALGREIKSSMVALAETTGTFLFDNLMPAIGNIITSLPIAVYALVKEGLPKFLDSGLELIKSVAEGILDGLPEVSTAFVTTMNEGLAAFTKNLPAMLEKGVQFISEFARGLLSNLPALITSAGQLVSSFVGFIEQNLPVILHYGGVLLGNLAMGILENLPQILSAMLNVCDTILGSVADLIPTLLSAGNDLIRGVATGILDGIKASLRSAAEKVKTTILQPIEDARDKIKAAIDKIKSYFNITLSFKGIRLPHISMSWNRSGVIAQAAKLLGIPGVPKFSVNWYKTGGIFDNPSLIGIGEAGPEAVVPLDALWSKLDRFVQNAINQSKNSGGSAQFTEAQLRAVVMESITELTGGITEAMSNIVIECTLKLREKVLAKALVPIVDKGLGEEAALAERGV